MPRTRVMPTASVVHVLIAVSTLFLFVSSWWMMALPLPSKVFTYRAFPFQLHKNVGITIALLAGIMGYARVAHMRSRKGAGMTARMPISAVVQDALLYGLVVACVLSGYLSSVYSGWPTRFWWLVNLPNWGYDNDALTEFYAAIPTWTSYGLLVVIGVHIGVAAYNTFRNEGFVRRMLHR